MDTTNTKGRRRGYIGPTSNRAWLAVTAVVFAACGSTSPGPRAQAWTEVKGLGHVVSAAAPSMGMPWLLGGGIIDASSVNHVTIWSAPNLSGPWKTDVLAPVVGLDGPYETIFALAPPVGGGPAVAVGSRPSPLEGYPRPSTWYLPGRGRKPVWRDVRAERELFGGPNVVGLGNMASGPHGYFIAGSWIGPGNHVVAAVWTSHDGPRWTRNDADPAFNSGPATQSYGRAIADGPAGVLLGGTTAVPTRSSPTREVGALWYSATGARWVRLPALSEADQTVVGAVRSVGAGWLAGGRAGTQPEVWTIDGHFGVAPTALPGTTSATVDDLAVTPGLVLAAGLTPSGQTVLWQAPRHGDQWGHWTQLTAPPAGMGWSDARLAAANGHTVLVVFNGDRSEVWRSEVGRS